MYMPRPPTPLEEYILPAPEPKKIPNYRERIGFKLGIKNPCRLDLGSYCDCLPGANRWAVYYTYS